MPSALYFKLRIFSEDKTKIELSAFHLYNGNTRVDQDAVISSGFESIQANLDILKNDNPIETTSLTVEDTTLLRKGQLYVIWTFSTATNVNAFRVGTGSSQSTTVDKFALSYSDNGSVYNNFINIGLDKRLSFPGNWQLTQLKPVGQCFPLVLKRGKEYKYGDGGTCLVGNDGRSLEGEKHWPVNGSVTDTFNNSTTYMSYLFSTEIPGIFEAGKFFFEVATNNKNKNDGNGPGAINYITMVLVPDNNERVITPSVLDSPVFSITSTLEGSLSNSNQNVWGATQSKIITNKTYYSTKIAFVPGYQNGFSIDFDNRELKYYNPTWNSQGTGPFNIPFATSKFKLFPIGTKYKLFFYFDLNFFIYFTGVKLNIGQDQFVNTTPIGFEPGLGPRWKEEVDGTISYKDYTFDNYNRELEPYSNDREYMKPHIVEQPTNIIVGGGVYYIKGIIKRVPDVSNKRFIAQLFSVETRMNISQCVVTSSGLYEFYGIEYGAYTVTSIDILNNTVSECIGPVYPLPII